MTQLNRNLRGWRRQAVDPRDRRLKTPMASTLLPTSAQVPVLPEVRDQGNIGSCTAHAGTTAASYLHMLAGKPDPVFSPLALYAMTRQLEGIPLREDSGCMVRSVFKAMRRFGIPLESSWPYIESKFNVDPPTNVDQEALDNQAITYLVCDDLAAVKHSIADKYPVIGGFDCYESMFTPEVDKSGVIPQPGQDDGLRGGHCVMFVAYDDSMRMVMFQNSWGKRWGRSGYGFLPYSYFRNGMATDFWTLRTKEM